MPGIHIHTSNKLEKLADIFSDLLLSSPLPPLKKEIILVQSKGMARWLALETADRINIWANCDCPFPNNFIRSIFSLVLDNVPLSSPYDKDKCVWHLMRIIPELAGNIHSERICKYLEDGDDIKLYQFASELADLFDQYTLYRTDMIRDWETGSAHLPDDDIWQSHLWCKLVQRFRGRPGLFEFHRGHLLEHFTSRLNDPGFDHRILPERLSVFGISSLPPYHLNVLSCLAQYIDINFFVMNPCSEYWFDIVADRDIVKISRDKESSQDILHLEQGNSLLASTGHLGRDFIAMLQSLDADYNEYFGRPETETLLSCIQNDVFALQENCPDTMNCFNGKHAIEDNDTSITFHSCHSRMREIEVLHDFLLDIFDNFPGENKIEPRHIMVMAPDITDYAPLIRSVFDEKSSSSTKLPYAISDQPLTSKSRYIETFFALLDLFRGRFTSSGVMALLKSEPVRDKFLMNENDLDILGNWIDKTGICWGLDADHKERIGLPPYAENTWRSGIDRLLLGYAMSSNGKSLFREILPYDNMEGYETLILGNFLDFMESLFSHTDILGKKHTLTEWSQILLQMADTLLMTDESSSADSVFMRQSLHELDRIQTQTFFTAPVSIDVIRSFLMSTLEHEHSHISGSTNFLTGAITFCSMLPMRTIPFRVICLLGMNDGLYPRSGIRKSFDLMAANPRKGDRSRRYDDRYIFLETLLSAREKLFISFEGQSVRDNSSRVPSVLVSEMMDYIDRGYTSAKHNGTDFRLSQHLTTIHRLQPFHPDYFNKSDDQTPGKLFSYSKENCKAANSLVSPHSKFPPLFSMPLPAPPESFRHIDLRDMLMFFSHPTKYFLVRRLGMATVDEIRGLKTSEPFISKGLERYKLQNQILEQLLSGGDPDYFFQVKKAENLLPHGIAGEVDYQAMVSEVAAFKKSLDNLFAPAETTQKTFEHITGEFKITGILRNIGTKGMLHYQYATLKPKDIIRCWIQHLVYNVVGNTDRQETAMCSYLAGRDRQYRYKKAKNAEDLLKKIINFYWQGLTEPLQLFPQTSFVFAREMFKGVKSDRALNKAGIEWEGDDYRKTGEKNDPYNFFCHRNLDLASGPFMELSRQFFEPALEHQDPYTGE